MLNHARTLLMNVPGALPQVAIPGDEAVDLRYQPLALPAYLIALRRILFGATPDRYMLNFRCWQFLTLLQHRPFAAFLTAFDTRVSYNLRGTPFLRLNGTSSNKLSGPTDAQLHIIGNGAPADISGRMYQHFTLTLPDSATIQVAQTIPPYARPTYALTLTDQLSAFFPLSDSGYSVALDSTDTSQIWELTTINRPRFDLGQLVAEIDNNQQPALAQLFGGENVEPYASCRNWWALRTEVPMRLSGLLIAMIWRMEALRG